MIKLSESVQSYFKPEDFDVRRYPGLSLKAAEIANAKLAKFATAEALKAQALVNAIKLRQKSDEACELPFDEDLGEALNNYLTGKGE